MPATGRPDTRRLGPGDDVCVGVAEDVESQNCTPRVAVVLGRVSTKVRDPRAQFDSWLNVRLRSEDPLDDEVHVVSVDAVWLSPDAFSTEDLWELIRRGVLPRVSFTKTWLYALEPSILAAAEKEEVEKGIQQEKTTPSASSLPSTHSSLPPPINSNEESTPNRGTKIPLVVEKSLLLSKSRNSAEDSQEASQEASRNSNPNVMEDFAFYQSLANVFKDGPTPSANNDGMEQSIDLAAEGVVPEVIVSQPLPRTSNEATPVLLEEDMDRQMLDRYLGEEPRPSSEGCTAPVNLRPKDIGEGSGGCALGKEGNESPPDSNQSTPSRVRGRASLDDQQREEKRARLSEDPGCRADFPVTHNDGEDRTTNTDREDGQMGAECAEESKARQLKWGVQLQGSSDVMAVRDAVCPEGAQLVEYTSDSTGLSSLQDPDTGQTEAPSKHGAEPEPSTALTVHNPGLLSLSESHEEEPSSSSPSAIWRSIPGSIFRESPVLDQESLQRFDRCRKEYENFYKASIQEEARRVRASKSKRLCPRPDLRAMQKMTTAAGVWEETGHGVVGSLNPEICFGHIPGLRIGDKFHSRAEMCVLGIHNSHMSGIDYVSEGRAGKGKSVVVAICQSGCYEDGKDGRWVMWYAGHGGNDISGSCRQEKAQKLERGNLALSNNRKFGGPPVRVFKKNQGTFVFDGLWMVVDMRQSLGLSGKKVYEFCLRRLPGQDNSHAATVKFGRGTAKHKKTASMPTPNPQISEGPKGAPSLRPPQKKRGRPRKNTLSQVGAKSKRRSRAVSEDPVVDRGSDATDSEDAVIWNDISRGMEVKPITVENSIDSFLPPGLSMFNFLSEHPKMKGARDWVTCQGFEYGVEFRYCGGIASPPTPDFSRPSDPHSQIHSFNQGKLAYVEGARKLPTLLKQESIVYECGPWCQCPLGTRCLQAPSQRPLCWNLQVFKTRDRGWGLRTLDSLPKGVFVGTFVGEIMASEIMTVGKCEDRYSMKLGKIQDLSTGRSKGRIGHNEQFYVSAKRYGNYCRFVNHSCDPNLFIQPVLSDHLDISLPKMCFFTSRLVEPGEELTYKYTGDSLNQVLDSGCFCTVCKRMAIVPVKSSK